MDATATELLIGFYYTDKETIAFQELMQNWTLLGIML